MATLQIRNSQTTNGWSSVFFPPGDARGREGKIVRDNRVIATNRWQGNSRFVAEILNNELKHPPVERMALLASVLAFIMSLSAVGFYQIYHNDIAIVMAFLFGLASCAFFARWLAKQTHPSKTVKFLNRIRKVLAYEGDEESPHQKNTEIL